MRILMVLAITLLGLTALTLPTQAEAQEWPTKEFTEPSTLPKILQPLQDEGAQIRFLGNHKGFNGWVIFNKGRPTFTYTSDDERVFFQGMMFGREGENITLQQLQDFRLRGSSDTFDTLTEVSRLMLEKEKQQNRLNAAEKLTESLQGGTSNDDPANTMEPTPPQQQVMEQPAPATTPATTPAPQAQVEQPKPAAQEPFASTTQPVSKSEKLLSDIERGNWVTFGTRGKPVLYAMIDPDCPHCQEAMFGLKPFLDQGALEIRVLPIAFEDKAKRVGALMLATGDSQTLFYNYIEGKLPELGNDTKVNVQGVERNVMTAVAWGFNATPMFFYRNAAGEVKIIRGVPGDYDMILKDLTGQ